MRRPIVLLALLALAASARAKDRPRDFAVRAGRIVTMDGPDLAPGVVVVRDRRIAAIGGPDLPIPEGLETIDASSQVLLPGFVEASSQRGLDRTYEIAANASFVRVTDALNPVSLEIEDALRNGITTIQVAPDDRAFLAGRAAIVHPEGISVDGMVVARDTALKISLLPGPGASRMGHLARLRELLEDTRKWMRTRDQRPRDAKPEPDPAHESIAQLLEGRLPALVYCPTAADVATAFAIANEHGFRVVPIVAPQAWRAATLLAENHVTAIVPPVMDAWERQPDGTLLHVVLPKVLSDAKVPFALTTDPYEAGAQHPGLQAALAVRWGVPREEALAALTRIPARLLGFGTRKGVLREGADADLVLMSGDPLDAASWVDTAWIRGERVYDRDQDEKLRRLLTVGSEPPLAAAEVDEDEHDEPEVDPEESRTPRDRHERAPARRWPFAPRGPR